MKSQEKIKVVQVNDVFVIISIKGEIILENIRFLEYLIENIRKAHHPKNYIFDISEVEFMSSMCIGLFMNLYKEEAKHNGKVIFASVPDRLINTFKLINLDKYIIICDSIKSALVKVCNKS